VTNKKKLLIYAHYYVPDVASTGQILKDLAEGISDTFDITVICTVPSYSGIIEEHYKRQSVYIENINDIKVIRIRVPEFKKGKKISRIKNIISYYFGALHATSKIGPYNYVLTISQPPILGGMLGIKGCQFLYRIHRLRPKFIYCIQDFNPEQVIAVGYFKNKLLLKLLMSIDKRTCKKSDLVITVGCDLATTLKKRFENTKVPAHVMINNWVDEKEIYPLASDCDGVQAFLKRYELLTNRQDTRFIIMYSGNIGLYYDLENLIKIIHKFKDAKTRPSRKYPNGRMVLFVFVGAGSLTNILKDYVSKHHMSNVVFIPYQDKDNLNYSLNAADVHWCVNAQGMKGVSCPSKYYGIAAAGKPIIGVLEPGTEIRYLIEKTQGGLVCEPGDYEKIEQNIQWFLDHDGSELLVAMGQRNRAYLLENLTKEMSIEKYKKAIEEL
jgi:glycosyltransferase involved in cell wall biosynthesis